MRDFIIKRFLQMIVVIFFSLTVVFFLIRLSGDPALLLLPPDTPREQIEEFRASLGFDRPLYVQYVEFVTNAVQGDFGKSLITKEDALSMVLSRVPATLQLAFSALGLSLLIAIPVGVLAAYFRNSIFDRISIFFMVLGQSMPNFWLGLLLIYVFAVALNWLPSNGSGTPAHLILPTVTLAAYNIARFSRFTRSTMLDVLQKDYIRTARASGTPASKIVSRFALKNTLIPIITLIALDLGVLIGGAVVAESVFAWPGIGMLIFNSLMNRDFPVVLAAVFFVSVVYSVLNLLADILYAYVNPQIKY